MPQLIQNLPYILAIIFAALPAPALHEYSHWFIGWIGDTGPMIQGHSFFPNGVHHREIKTMDPGLIRLSGLAVFVWIPPWITATAQFLAYRTPEALFIALIPSFVLLMSTKSDAIAVRNPEEFRQRWIEDDFPRIPLFLPNWIMPEWLPRF
jgi:hypothetical protein